METFQTCCLLSLQAQQHAFYLVDVEYIDILKLLVYDYKN